MKMQTFLAYPNYYESLKCLDSSRLGNQVYREGKTIVSGGWKNHPIAKMWKGYEYSLCEYCLEGLKVLRERNLFYPKWEKWFAEKQKSFINNGYPNWLGNEALHSSHRSNLLFKGRKDIVYLALKKLIKISKKEINRDNIEMYELLCKENNINIGNNWYRQFGWKEPDNLPYVWVV